MQLITRCLPCYTQSNGNCLLMWFNQRILCREKLGQFTRKGLLWFTTNTKRKFRLRRFPFKQLGWNLSPSLYRNETFPSQELDQLPSIKGFKWQKYTLTVCLPMTYPVRRTYMFTLFLFPLLSVPNAQMLSYCIPKTLLGFCSDHDDHVEHVFRQSVFTGR